MERAMARVEEEIGWPTFSTGSYHEPVLKVQRRPHLRSKFGVKTFSITKDPRRTGTKGFRCPVLWSRY